MERKPGTAVPRTGGVTGTENHSEMMTWKISHMKTTNGWESHKKHDLFLRCVLIGIAVTSYSGIASTDVIIFTGDGEHRVARDPENEAYIKGGNLHQSGDAVITTLSTI